MAVRYGSLLFAAILAAASVAFRDDDRQPDATLDQRVELGQVQWGRDLEGACRAAQKSGRPVLLLFQEVPG